EPSSSRFSISAATISAGSLTAAAARTASSFRRLALSAARTSMATSAAERKSLIFILRSRCDGKSRAALVHNPDRALRLVGGAQAVADAGLGQQILRALGVPLDLASELAHIDPQILRVGRLVPELLQQEPVREHLAGVLHEQAQELVLLWRELDLRVG